MKTEMNSSNVDFKTDQELKVERYAQLNKTIKKGQIVFVGSSLMEMFPIEELLQEINSDRIIYNRGIGGYTTVDLLKVLDICVYDLLPSKIFINIGTNDLSNPSIPISDIMSNYDRIISLIQHHLPNAVIYMMAYYPVNYDAATPAMKPCLLTRTNDKINIANKRVQQLAQQHGVKYIDVNRNLKDSEGNLKAEYTIEGMHIKKEGYRAILDDIMVYVNEPITNK